MKMMMHDAQTSGGLFMSVNPDHVEGMVNDLKTREPELSVAVIGEVLSESPRRLYVE
jgi:hydrogenase maturation factor